MKLPRSKLDGPTQTGQVVAMGYSHTPQGAILAAIRGQAHLALAADNAWGKTLAVVSAPGPGRDEFAAARIALSIEGDLPKGRTHRFVAFKVNHYSEHSAAIVVAAEIGTPAITFAQPVALSWLAGDWRIVLPTAAENITATEVTSLDGYTRLEQP
ncbi:hypothetical protein ACIGO9_30720 [Nocardia asteroides]|uniref:hypothetical protein n=1 Tax=Nocardia asteroides TaxID=1824 RepID=UPI0037C69F36